MIKLVEYFINKPKVVNLILIFILITGTISIVKTKKERVRSEADYGVVYITTIFPGASPKDVEIKITWILPFKTYSKSFNLQQLMIYVLI